MRHRHHPVAEPQHRRAVADDDGAAPGEHARQGGEDRGLGVGVHALGRFVEQQQGAVGEQRAGERDPAALPGRQAGAGVADGGVERDVQGGGAGGAGQLVGGGVRCPEAQVVGDGAGEQHGPLRHPRHPAAPCGGVDRVEGGVADHDRPGVGPARAAQQVEQGGLARPARPGDAHDLAGRDREREPGEDGVAAAPGDPDLPEAQGNPARIRCGPSSARGERFELEDPERGLRGGQPVEAVVEPGTDRAQREVHLGRQDDHEQRGVQVEVAVHEAQAHGDGDERDRQRRQQLEGERGQERHPQRGRRRDAVALGDLAQPTGLAPRAAEGDQNVEAGDEVEEVVAEHGERAPPALHGPFRVHPDEDHEDRDQRDGGGHDHCRDPVGAQHAHPDREGHDGGHQERRQVAAHVAVEPVDAVGRERRGLARGRQAGVVGPELEGLRDQAFAHRGDHRRRRPRARRLAGPGEQGPPGDDGEQRGEHPAERGEALAAEEAAGHRARDQIGLDDHQPGGRDADPGAEHHVPAHGCDVAQQARVEGLHACSSARDGAGVGMCARETRWRKTQ